ncbi:hypothetical protein QT711_18815 [Sporosarcina saromensis]|uniref:Uncharacterized protein n=1 Tax=Sporosarcina saromensis TaxID=359365 RepID=A0ABU4GDZ2_9BACL|nr:hypothetical protein [Sporosarcina saromensis]MDW0115209.1 hypothetical protein [Sporosarcina saromensis]
MDEMISLILASKLPDQLKEYLKSSSRIKEIISTEKIMEIEDLYIFYDSLYTFDTSEFSAYTITSLQKCKDLDAFYYYLKKVIDTNLELETKDNKRKDHESNHKSMPFKFQEATKEFCLLIDKVYKNDEDINLIATYKSLGKMELIYDLFQNQYHKNILDSGKKVLEKYTKPNE